MFTKIKTHKETIKTVLLTFLMAGLLAFVLGMNYQKALYTEIEQAKASVIPKG